MAEIRDYLLGPYLWLSIAAAAVAGVWWVRMTPTTSNISIAVCVIAVVIGVFLFVPTVSKESVGVRLLWAIAAGSISSLILYYSLWVAITKPQFGSFVGSWADYQSGTVIGGVAWSDKFTDVRVAISNPSKDDYLNIDVVIKPDQPIAAFGKTSGGDDASLSFHQLPTVPAMTFLYPDRKDLSAQVLPIASSGGVRVRLGKLPRESVAEIVFASVSINDEKRGIGNPDAILAINMSNGASYWFALKEHSDAVYGRRPHVGKIDISGKYQLHNGTFDISENISVINVEIKRTN